MPKKLFLIIDGHALIYRAFFSMPPLTDKDGRLVNAVYGFTKNLLLSLRDFEPQYLSVVFDHKEASKKRKEAYSLYKANRPKMPKELRDQVGIAKEVVDSLNVPKFELAGFEGDDLIGFLVSQVNQEKNLKSTIVTGDKDLLQLVNDKVTVFIPDRTKKRGAIEYNVDLVKKFLGIYPHQVVDYKALLGDASDNIPGVKGVGAKTALKLINDFGSLENLYKKLEEIEKNNNYSYIKGKLLQNLKEQKEKAFLSYQLAKIDCLAPLDFNLKKCLIQDYDKVRALAIFDQLDFKSLTSYLPKDRLDAVIEQTLF